MDLRLGDGNGLEVVKEIQNSNADSRIVMLTGSGNIPTAVAAIKQGAIDYLAKPADADDVEKALLADPNKKADPPDASSGNANSGQEDELVDLDARGQQDEPKDADEQADDEEQRINKVLDKFIKMSDQKWEGRLTAVGESFSTKCEQMMDAKFKTFEQRQDQKAPRCEHPPCPGRIGRREKSQRRAPQSHGDRAVPARRCRCGVHRRMK